MSDIALDQEALPTQDIGVDLSEPAEMGTNLVENQVNTDDSSREVLPIDRERSVLERYLDDPRVKQAAPIVIGLLVLLFCVFFYMWISAPGYRAVYPGMLESDRHTAYELLLSSGFDVKINLKLCFDDIIHLKLSFDVKITLKLFFDDKIHLKLSF